MDNVVVEKIELVRPNASARPRYTGTIPKYSPTGTAPSTSVDHLPVKFKTIIEMINKGFCVCVIMRGLPGSGKSFLAQQIINETVKDEDHILSADKFFMGRGGQYRFDRNRIEEAHEHTQKLFAQKASTGVSPLVVDNTNVAYWQMLYYIQVSVQYGYHIEIIEPETPWKFTDSKLANKNVHGVPIESIKRMKQNYETGVSLSELMNTYDIKPGPPKMRNIPPLFKEEQKTAIVKEVPKLPPLQVPKQPPLQVPKLPSPQEPSCQVDLIDFEECKSDAQQEAKPHTFEQSTDWLTSAKALLQWNDQPLIPETQELKNKLDDDKMQQIFNWQNQVAVENVEQAKTVAEQTAMSPVPSVKPSDSKDTQTKSRQRRNKKNKSAKPKLTPHRKFCPNENFSFTQIRELYPTVNDSYLWDLFVRCDGNAGWAADLLFEENQMDQMESGDELSCHCFSSEAPKPATVKKEEVFVPVEPQPSCSTKPKVNKQVAKQIDLDDWLETKQSIEKGITIGQEHYPEHVNKVKNWRKGPAEEPSEQQAEAVKTPSSPLDIGDELHALSINEELIFELDEEYGGGLLKSVLEENQKFPSKVFIKKSIAHQLYLGIVEAYYSQKEETRIRLFREDEEMAKKLNETENKALQKTPKKKTAKDLEKEVLEGMHTEATVNHWQTEEPTFDDMAVKMSKEKLVEMFPDLGKEDLFQVFEGTNYNFKETVEYVKDSLFCTQEEREKINKAQKKIFNKPWTQPEPSFDESEDPETSNQLKSLEEWQQDIADHYDERKICHLKAQEAIRTKNYEMASYLSQIALFHKKKAEEAEHQVANLRTAIHQKSQKSSKELDLHYLSASAAETSVDAFLDGHIQLLRDIKKPYESLFIITGQGLHSHNGVPTLKNKTKIQLRNRGLKCNENNPGLLEVKIFQNSMLFNEFQG